MSSGVPICSIRPPFITITRSEIASASSWSCVTYSDVMSSRRCNSRSSTRISARSLASRLDSGSSNSSTLGENAIARATATRCCCPPDSFDAGRSAKACICTRSSTRCTFSRTSAARQLAHAQAVGDVVEHRHVRPDRVGLEHHRHAALLGRHVAAFAGRNTRSRRSAGCCRHSASPGRRPRAASWSCRSRRGRAASPVSPGAMSKPMSSTAVTSP